MVAFEEHDYQRALELFRGAFALVSVDSLRFNMAVCYERLARFREAAAEYEAAAASTTLGPDERARAATQLAEVRRRMGTLLVRGIAGHVRVDGAIECDAPCEFTLDPGSHRVVMGEGPSEQVHTVELDRGQSLTLVFEPIALVEPVAPAAPVEPSGPSYTPGPLLFIGAGAALLGGGGIVGFGLSTEDFGNRFSISPSVSLADEGELMRGLTNASIALAGAGAVLVLIDVVIGISERNER